MARMTLLVLGLILLIPSSALANTLTLEATQEFGGGTPPAGDIPWVRATFDDTGKTQSVDLRFEALNLTGSEHVGGLYLNLNPAFDASGLAFFPIEKHGDFVSPVISLGNDAFKADGDGKYDLYFEFATTGNDQDRFGPGDWFNLGIGSTTGLDLTAPAFSFESAPDGNSGPFYMAARIEGIGPNNASAWIATPEPSSCALAMLALIGLCVVGRPKC